MKVSEGKEIWIGNKPYFVGDELPANYTLKEKKKNQPAKTEVDKK